MKFTLLFLSALSLQASTLCSGPGAVVVVPHPTWETSECEWISFANTGHNGEVVPNSDEPYTFMESFILPGRGRGHITVWADDTARVRLNGAALVEPNFVLDAHCADGVIGCQPGEGLTIVLDSWLVAGLNTLYIDVWQRGGGPTGVMYSGQVAPIPEPNGGVLVLFGGMLLVVARVVRR